MPKKKVRILIRNGTIYIDPVDGLSHIIRYIEQELNVEERIVEACCVTDMYSVPLTFIFSPKKKEERLPRGLCG